ASRLNDERERSDRSLAELALQEPLGALAVGSRQSDVIGQERGQSMSQQARARQREEPCAQDEPAPAQNKAC
ncbi:MAG: hypothetical protein ACRETU_05565, partial [Steroidobacterales bacterium]